MGQGAWMLPAPASTTGPVRTRHTWGAGWSGNAVSGFSDRDLRNALGRFATGVTLVTTMTPNGPLGMTVNSFASVSLHPPLVLWSPARISERFPAFEAASHFAVHVLARDQQPLAERFARSGDDFSGVAYGRGAGGVPLIEGTAARFECRHAAQYDGGDHLIMVGEVLSIREADVAPLLYHRGHYTGLTG